MEPRERMQQAVKWLIYNGVAQTQRELAEKAGYNPTSFCAVLGGLNPLSTKFVNRVCALDRHLRPIWVLTGEGEMTTTAQTSVRKGEQRPLAPKTFSTRKDDRPMVPYYPELPVSAGDVDAPPYNDLTDGVYIPGVKAEAYFPISGCSMMPTVNPGDLIGVVSVDRYDRIDPDAIYMVITREGERMIKHIQPTPDDDPEIILFSDNPQYAPFRRMKEDIIRVLRVVYVGKKL